RLSFPASCQASADARSLVSRLLSLEPLMRIGACGGVEEVMRHPWFAGICWNPIDRQRKASPLLGLLREARKESPPLSTEDVLEAAPFTCDKGRWKPQEPCASSAFDWTNPMRLRDLAARTTDFTVEGMCVGVPRVPRTARVPVAALTPAVSAATEITSEIASDVTGSDRHPLAQSPAAADKADLTPLDPNRPCAGSAAQPHPGRKAHDFPPSLERENTPMDRRAAPVRDKGEGSNTPSPVGPGNADYTTDKGRAEAGKQATAATAAAAANSEPTQVIIAPLSAAGAQKSREIETPERSAELVLSVSVRKEKTCSNSLQSTEAADLSTISAVLPCGTRDAEEPPRVTPAASPGKLVTCALRSLRSVGGTGRPSALSLRDTGEPTAGRGSVSSPGSLEAAPSPAASVTPTRAEKGPKLRKSAAVPRIASLASQRECERASARQPTPPLGAPAGSRGRLGYSSASPQNSPIVRARPVPAKGSHGVAVTSSPGPSRGPSHAVHAGRIDVLPPFPGTAAVSVRVNGTPVPGSGLSDRKKSGETKQVPRQLRNASMQPGSTGSRKNLSAHVK
ncbi:uncharacterized protein LOC113146947, partial [Cyclospora cayetanensis]|uniref:Uncharacterized protein LOC113146947 n=1 Tax=Cyclospora cayetanensis TaxID=88456 RepID=A0A6P6RUT1_9EIME